MDGYIQGSAEQQKRILMAGGMAGGDENIYLHPGLYENVFQRKKYRDTARILTHEYAHRFQQTDLGIWDGVFLHSNTLLLRGGVSDRNVITRSLKKAYQSAVQGLQEYLAYRHHKNKYLSIRNYFTSETEVQARLHEVMVHGYAGWQKMPTNKTELWAALANYGLTPPRAIRKELEASEQGRQALSDFRVSPAARHRMRMAIRDLGYAHDFAVFKAHKEAYWQTGIPRIYGALLELYGDGPGRARLDAGVNPRAAKALLSCLKHNPSTLTVDKIEDMVAQVPPVWANAVMTSLLKMRFMTDVDKDKSLQVAKTILRHPVFAETIISETALSYDNLDSTLSSFVLAVQYNDRDILDLFFETGYEISMTQMSHNLSGDPVFSFGLHSLVTMIKNLEKDILKMPKLDSALASDFDAAALVDQRRRIIRNAKEGLNYVALNVEDPDVKMIFKTEKGELERSMNDFLRNLGEAPVKNKSTLSDTSRMSETMHV
jgi:hypothetical protein